METDTTLVRADGVVELYAVADVVLNFSLVVNPGHAECEDAVGLDHALYDAGLLPLGMLVVYVFYTKKNFFHCLEILFLTRMLGLEAGHDFLNIHDDPFRFKGCCFLLTEAAPCPDKGLWGRLQIHCKLTNFYRLYQIFP